MADGVPALALARFERNEPAALTPRELEVLLASVLAKLGVSSWTEAVPRGIRTGLVPL